MYTASFAVSSLDGKLKRSPFQHPDFDDRPLSIAVTPDRVVYLAGAFTKAKDRPWFNGDPSVAVKSLARLVPAENREVERTKPAYFPGPLSYVKAQPGGRVLSCSATHDEPCTVTCAASEKIHLLNFNMPWNGRSDTAPGFSFNPPSGSCAGTAPSYVVNGRWVSHVVSCDFLCKPE